MNELFAIVGGLLLAVLVIYPFGTSTTSGTRFEAQTPFTWSNWLEEARVSLWNMNPVTICVDTWQGYEDFLGAIVRFMGFIVVTAALFTATALIGWGIYSWAL